MLPGTKAKSGNVRARQMPIRKTVGNVMMSTMQSVVVELTGPLAGCGRCPVGILAYCRVARGWEKGEEVQGAVKAAGSKFDQVTSRVLKRRGLEMFEIDVLLLFSFEKYRIN